MIRHTNITKRKTFFLFTALVCVSPQIANAAAYCMRPNGHVRCYVNGQQWQVEAPKYYSVAPGSYQNDIRFEVRHGDTSDWDRAHNHPAERAELGNINAKLPRDKDIWLKFDMMVEPGPRVNNAWTVLGQLHPTENPGDTGLSPAWAQELDKGDVFKIVMRSSGAKPVKSSPAPRTLFTDYHFQRGHNYNFTYHFKYSQKGGFLQVWRDGKQIVNYFGPLGYTDWQGPWLKFGIYRQPTYETLVVHYSNLSY